MYKSVNTKSKDELLRELKAENFARKTVSFYRYVKIADPVAMREFLFENFEKLNCKGRVYVAPEGINAQINVPEQNWASFDQFIQNIPEFHGTPYKIAVEEKGKGILSSFVKLIVKVRPKIVADGIEDPNFDPSLTGEYADAEEVNKMIDRGATVIDMRNFYEAMIGRFKGAKIMQVDTFREQLTKVREIFGDKKDEEVLLYCTGGIRCEKASAWMKYNGFKKVKHVKGGIIDYARQVKEQGLENKFLGKNFVFDERMGERVGEEIISYCQSCKKAKCDDYVHCKNQLCHVLFLCCPCCCKRLSGYCSRLCAFLNKYQWLNKIYLGERRQNHPKQFRKNYKRLEIEA